MLSDNIIKLSIAAQLKHRVEKIFIAKETIHIDYVRMIQKCLDFQLANELLQDVVLNNFFLLKYLQSHHETCIYLSNQINFPEFALSQFSYKFKILFGDLTLLVVAVGQIFRFRLEKPRRRARTRRNPAIRGMLDRGGSGGIFHIASGWIIILHFGMIERILSAIRFINHFILSSIILFLRSRSTVLFAVVLGRRRIFLKLLL